MAGTRRRGADTRAEIQDAALTLFTERGYDATTMREIAERLGITKAALYYHFDSKEAIIRSLLVAHLDALDDLLDQAAAQPPSPARSAELLRRWLALTAGPGLRTMRLAAANLTALRTALAPEQDAMIERIERASELILHPGAGLQDRLRVRAALLSVPAVVLAARGTDAEDADILAAATRSAALMTADLIAAATPPVFDRG